MSKSKSVFVTALVAVMLALILVGLYILKMRVWMIAAGLLGLYGFACAAFNFCQWLGKETPIPPLPLPIKQTESKKQEPDEFWPPDPAWTDTFDRIKAELEDEPPQVGSTPEIMGYEK